ncbi:MAG TPA: peptidoglycan DD-metalloendopeptidase family protein [Flavisolibacter sp.]|nr:peptidoglycan DD-metalloendopeptidase family protein [Flavisolibacter sp.]
MKKIVFLLMGVLIMASGYAQDKAKMERERQQLQKELREIQETYNKVKGQQKATIGQLTILQNKMRVQEQYISNINNEIKLLTDDIYLSNVELTRLQRQLDTLKSEYARSVVYTYKNSNSYSYLNFIFSANSFNDALRRVSYLKSYRAYNEGKVKTIKETQTLIEQRKQQLLAKTNQKQSALTNQKSQLNELEGQKKEKDQVVAKLKTQATDLSKQMAAKKKRDQTLKSQINAIIKREIAEARRREKEENDRRIAAEKERAKANAPSTSPKTNTTASATPSTAPKTTAPERKEAIPLNAGQLTLANKFESNRGGLPWPVDNGYVSIPFGVSNIGGLMMDNPCISISTPSAGVPVKSVFDGEVKAVSSTGEGMMVMIQHGRYFTVYTVASASVNRGDQVRTGQTIGRAATADDGTGGQVDFYLMIGEKNVNPRPWLR